MNIVMFLWPEGVLGGQIHQRMCAQYGDNALSPRVVYEWIEMFKKGCTSMTDTERSGHPTTATTAQNEDGPILEKNLERGTTVTSATYCDLLQEGLKPEIHSKRKGRLSEGVLLLHDNDCSHTMARTMETLRKLKWEVRNIQLTVQIWRYLIFTFLDHLNKEALGERSFRCSEDIKNGLHQWLHAQPKAFYYDGIKQLVGRWEKFVEKQGDYVEK
jgi:transposase